MYELVCQRIVLICIELFNGIFWRRMEQVTFLHRKVIVHWCIGSVGNSLLCRVKVEEAQVLTTADGCRGVTAPKFLTCPWSCYLVRTGASRKKPHRIATNSCIIIVKDTTVTAGILTKYTVTT